MANKLHLQGGRRQGLAAALVLILALLCASQVLAQPFNELSPQQQQVLQPFAKDWDSLPREKQDRLRKGAERWLNMSPEQRDEAKQRLKK